MSCEQEGIRNDQLLYAGLNIINSIADMEHSLAYILEAEGNKIEKVVCTTERIGDILEVNHSVHETITSIIQLEQVLYSKLQVAKEFCLQKERESR
ncbi:MAG: hypothetical protein R3Y47_09980 [Lachnospiraceae bacterium]